MAKVRIRWSPAEPHPLCSQSCDLFGITNDYQRSQCWCIIGAFAGMGVPGPDCPGPGLYTLTKLEINEQDIRDIAEIMEESKELENGIH